VQGLIAYDTYYGNGAQVAAAIAGELRLAGHEPTLVDLRSDKVDARLLTDSRFLVVGGPTRMKHMSRRARRFARKLDASCWAGRPALVYDTYGPLDADPAKNEGNPWLYPGGATELHALLAERGLVLPVADLRCLVSAMKGPLAEGALDDARAAARALARALA
jgi:flavodoxin